MTVVRGLRGLGRLSGRDSRRQFWVYTGWVGGAVLVAYQLALAAWLAPDVFQRRAPGAGPIPDELFVASAVFALTLVVLLGAAVSRRLHDTDRTAAWGLLPLPFLFFGLYGMQRLTFGFEETDAVDAAGFLIVFLNNAAYLAALGLLIWRLAAVGTVDGNRYGDPPEPRATQPPPPRNITE